MDAKSYLSIRRTLFPYGYAVQYDYEVVHSRFKLPVLVDYSIRKFLSRDILSKSSILDIKGRDPDVLMKRNVEEALGPKSEELLFLSGKVLLFKNKEEEIWEPFTVRIHTRFESFVGNHHISHTLEVVRTGALPPFVDVWDLGRAFPIAPEHFRLGLEFFSSSFISASLGFAPTVRETLLLESSAERTIIGILAEGLRGKESLPLTKGHYLEKIAAVTQDCFGFNLIEDYRSRVK